MSDPDRTLYLASSSPRRAQLLAAGGIPFALASPGEEPTAGGVPHEVAVARATAKALDATVPTGDVLILGVDTVVEIDGREYGKPVDSDDAAAMLRALSGKHHRVHTGHCLRRLCDDEAWTELASATVSCAELDDAALAEYVASDAWRGKAGGYGIQDIEAWFVELVDGDRDTVIGLSIRAVSALLERAR